MTVQRTPGCPIAPTATTSPTEPLPTPTPTPAPAPAPSAKDQFVSVGQRSSSIKTLEQRLKKLGYDTGKVDGTFDRDTQKAVQAFRKDQKELGDKSSALSKASRDVLRREAAALEHAPERRRLAPSTQQARLDHPGKVDGFFDRNTLRASRRFERKHGGGTDGSIGEAQLNKMEKLVKQQGVTLSQLRRIMPNLPLSKAKAYLPHLNKAMAEAKITTEQRKAMFLAQLAHESVELRYFEEIASGAAYEGRRDLGNIYPGDGVRFKGRGPIQLTGRSNYRAAGKALGLPLENNPKMVSRPSVGSRTSAWFWTSRGLNHYADQGNFREVTRRINGGYNGYEDRLKYYRRALQVL